ncbi:MAG: hypothetical protein HC880_16885 [Bacteroidia bacterium]|nr:hypothetical protein [Bacteroidia bacterium]
MPLDEYNKRGKEVEDNAKVEFEKALPYFEKLYAKEENKNNTQVLRPLAQIYAIMGKKDKSDEMMKRLEILDSAEEGSN